MSIADAEDALTSNMKINNIHLIDISTQPKPIEEMVEELNDADIDDIIDIEE